jgi:glycerate 2-kinase
MRILIASDKYKGSLTASDVAHTLKQVLTKGLPDCEIDLCPIADGGEGTTEAMITALGGEWVETQTLDAHARPLTARYGWMPNQTEAVLEMSAASGLALVNDLPLQPHLASTHGTGLMMLDAMQRGAKRLVIGIGGSATNDGGLGMAAALGYRFLDFQDQPISPVMADLHRLDRIIAPQTVFPEILVACDVDNPLLGPHGATRIYGPQKGVTDFPFFEDRLAKLAHIAARDLGSDPQHIPGSGAAGGLGYGLMAFCGARLTSGFDLISQQIRLEKRVAQADLIITGEGRLDAQTLHGKGPIGVALMARRLGKAVIAFAGSIDSSPALHAHFDLTYAIKPSDMPLSQAIAQARQLLSASAESALPQIRTLLGLAPAP